MDEQKPPDPKPPVIVEVEYFYKSERWYGYKIPGVKNMQVYGATPEEAEDRLHQVLIFQFGPLGYSIKVVPHE